MTFSCVFVEQAWHLQHPVSIIKLYEEYYSKCEFDTQYLTVDHKHDYITENLGP